MSTAFRILHAAQRLGRFTAAELAEQSSVGLDKVAPFIAENAPLFVSQTNVDSQETVYATRASTAVRLAEEISQTELPSLPTGFQGQDYRYLFAARLLYKVFPNVQPSERRFVLDSVSLQVKSLLLDEPSYRSIWLIDTFTALDQINEISEGILEGFRSTRDQAVQAVMHAIESVCSGALRRARELDWEELELAIENIIDLEVNCARVEKSFNTKWLDGDKRNALLKSFMILLGAPDWDFLVGDLAKGGVIQQMCSTGLPAEAVSQERRKEFPYKPPVRKIHRLF